MSEILLDALMKLYALLTNVRQESMIGSARDFIEEELKKRFSSVYVSKYVNLFNFYLTEFHKDTYSSEKSKVKRQSNYNYNKIDQICDELNKELEAKQKIELFVQLFEFIRHEKKTSNIADEVVDKLSKGMMVDELDYKLLKQFVISGPQKVEKRDRVLIISGDKEPPLGGFKHLYNPRQQIYVWVLYVKSTQTFVFRYIGERNLYLNGHRVLRDNAYILSVGSVIKTSRMPPIYYGKVAELFIQKTDNGRVVMEVRDAEYKFNDKQIGIHAFSFSGRSGQLVGIMGGSGTGKSTLLNVLNGSYPLSSGSIKVNGLEISEHAEELKGVIGFVPQEDLLIEELTVFENLYFNAQLCFSKMSKKQIVDLVEDALLKFDLVEARNLVVGNPLNKVLSGGQRKRLNIALELIREPSILFVDEPTSGLSSLDSEKVMGLLKRQTLKGRLVVVNIHQPSSDIYKNLDKLLIIDKGGYIIYGGNPMDAIVYFKEYANYVNPEESECVYCGNVKVEQPMRIIESRMVDPNGRLIRKRKISPKEWHDLYKDKIEGNYTWINGDNSTKEPLPKNLYNIPGRLKQFFIYAYRDAFAKFKDRQYMLINMLEAPVLAVILGYFTKYVIETKDGGFEYILYKNDNIPSYLFMLVIVALFLGLNVSAEEIIKDRKLLQREKFLNLSRLSYINSKVLIMFVISAIQTATLVILGNVILEIHDMNWSYWLILFSASCFSNMLGLNISSGLNSVVSIYILIPLLLVPQLLFSGVIVNFDKLHSTISTKKYVPIVGDLMVSRWAYEAIAVEQYSNNNFEKHFFKYDKIISRSAYYYSFLLPKLKSHIDDAKNYYNNNDLENTNYNLDIVRNGLKEVCEKEFDNNKLSVSLFNNYTIAIDSLIKQYNNIYSETQAKKDSIYKDLIKKMGSSQAVNQLRENNQNAKLRQFMLKKGDLKYYYFRNGYYYPNRNPVLRDGTSSWGRAHYLSSSKKIGNIKIYTPYFNIMIIWLFSILLYFTLYFDVLRKIIYYFEKIKLRKAFTVNLNKI